MLPRLFSFGLPQTCLRVFWVLLLLWYEVWIFRHNPNDCQWPDKYPVQVGLLTWKEVNAYPSE